MSDLQTQIVETWQIHNRVNLYLLDAIETDALTLSLKEKGRTIAALFAHVHNVRLMWLKPAAPSLLDGLDKLDDAATKAQIQIALTNSGDAMAQLLQESASTGKVKSFKRGVVPFLGYLVAHESHHRGQIGWILKHTGHPLDRAIAFGLWDWNAR
ncbi:MAG TPA: DinB family protein [Tepidisphaeraceae bacterium]|nr:DinB family protein [Tepidisphaeraceae bacterium]